MLSVRKANFKRSESGVCFSRVHAPRNLNCGRNAEVGSTRSDRSVRCAGDFGRRDDRSPLGARSAITPACTHPGNDARRRSIRRPTPEPPSCDPRSRHGDGTRGPCGWQHPGVLASRTHVPLGIRGVHRGREDRNVLESPPNNREASRPSPKGGPVRSHHHSTLDPFACPLVQAARRLHARRRHRPRPPRRHRQPDPALELGRRRRPRQPDHDAQTPDVRPGRLSSSPEARPVYS